jgi:4-hydroxy-tetrahydrodipicolinate reductase
MRKKDVNMVDTIGIAITGASGRMGQMLIKTIMHSDTMHLAGAIEQSRHDWVGRDVGDAMGTASMGVIVSDDAATAISDVDVIIDFTIPQATVAFAELAAAAGVAHIIGTTGFNAGHLAQIAKSAQKIPIVRAGNMSLGINLLVKLTKQVAVALDADFDIEIIEAHHNKKIDAPSGTALMLGEAAAEGRNVRLEDVRDTSRDGIVGARKQGDIGFVAIRGGDIVGEHDVMFASSAERITLRHVASDRTVFARGALKAALWVHSQMPGEYDMFDVLGLN